MTETTETNVQSFRHKASFGKGMEFWLIGKMLMENLDVYIPLVDDHGVDCVIKRADGTFIEVQIKASSKEAAEGSAALFAGISHEKTENFYFVFYSERHNAMWILSSEEFINISSQNKKGKHEGDYTICFNGSKFDLKKHKEPLKAKFKEYRARNFKRLHGDLKSGQGKIRNCKQNPMLLAVTSADK